MWATPVLHPSPERFAYINRSKTTDEAALARALAVYGDAARTSFGS